MPLIKTKTNEVGFLVIPGDDYPGFSEEVQDTYFPSIFQNNQFSIDIEFSYLHTEESMDPEVPNTEIQVNILDVGITLPPYSQVSMTVVDPDPTLYKVRVSGSLTGLFPSEVYEYLMKNRSVKQLNPPPTGDWLAIVGWQIPSIRKVTFDYGFTVSIEPNPYDASPIEVTYSQIGYWDFSQSLTYFQDSLAQGKL